MSSKLCSSVHASHTHHTAQAEVYLKGNCKPCNGLNGRADSGTVRVMGSLGRQPAASFFMSLSWIVRRRDEALTVARERLLCNPLLDEAIYVFIPTGQVVELEVNLHFHLQLLTPWVGAL